MTLSDISLHRLRQQQIIQPKFKEADEVLSWLGAIQGQDYSGAKWSIGLRLTKCTDNDVENALANKKILRTWLMRGTLHIVAAKDIWWMLSLLAPRVISGNTRRYKELELDEQTLLRSNKILAKALLEHKQLNRKELLNTLEKNKISTKGQRAAYMLQRASYDGLICQTTTIRNTPNYVLLDEVASKTKKIVRDEALAELVGRYFKSRGPATLQDFVWWSGLTVADVKTGLEANKLSLITDTYEGQTYWLSSESQNMTDKKPSIQMLPGFDEFLLGYKNRSASIDPQYNTRWCPGNNGMFFPFIVENGRVAGIWKRTFKKESVIIEINSFESNTLPADPALLLAANQFSQFTRLKLILQ